MPFAFLLREIESKGMLFDFGNCVEHTKKLDNELEEVAKQIYKEAGHKFIILSPVQLGKVLYDELGVLEEQNPKESNKSTRNKTKTLRTTSEEILSCYADAHPIIPLVLKYRGIQKQSATLKSLLKSAQEQTRLRIEKQALQTQNQSLYFSFPDVISQEENEKEKEKEKKEDRKKE
eukprot:Anaeramoba_ignava/a618100_4.p1 GENE.a618100_4~~a618100_4.p1  ORF type:complete len:176 (+),score=65.70 a618100_4:865-1392(+)